MTDKVRIAKEAMRTYKQDNKTSILFEYKEIDSGTVKMIACYIKDDKVEEAIFYDEDGGIDFMLIDGHVVRP